MENFSKKKQYDEEQNKDDLYLQELNRKMQNKMQVGLISKELTQQYQKNDDLDSKNGFAYQRVVKALQFWGTIFFVASNSFMIYPISVKFVKKIFRLQGFWNIHFAITPIIVNWNAICLGFMNGYYHYYYFKQNNNL